MIQSEQSDSEEQGIGLLEYNPEPFVSTKGTKRIIAKRKKKMLTDQYKPSYEKFKEYLELRYAKSTIHQYLWAYEKYGWKITSQNNLDSFMVYISHQRNNNPMYLGFVRSYIDCFELPYKITKSRKRNITTTKPIKYFTKDEIDKMIKQLPKKMGLIVRLYAETGLRLNELIKTPRDKINVDKREITGVGKNNKPFKVYYSEKTNELMKLLLTHNQGGYPFITKTDSKDPGRLFYYHFRKELDKIGLKGHPHMIRHYIGHYLRTVKKWDLQQIKVKLRHSRLESVPSYTPITIRKNGEIDIISIEGLWDNIKNPIKQKEDKQIKKCNTFFCLDRDNGKMKINEIHRHKFKGELIKINCGGGVVDISNNHSLFNGGGTLVKAGDLKIGQKICIMNPRPISWKWGLKDSKNIGFIGTKEIAWLYGFFAAEGSLGKKEVVFYNFDEDKLLKCQKIIKDNFQKKGFIGKGKNPRITINDRRLVNFFKEHFYTKDKLKKIPQFILNSNIEIKKGFLDGYNEGDGDTGSERAKIKQKKQEYHCFTSNSQVLMAGLLLLVRQTTKQKYNLYTRKDFKNVIQANFTHNLKKDSKKVKKIMKVDYEGWLYDLSTDTGKFYCGVGNILAHNTTGIYTEASEEEVRQKMEKEVFEDG